MSGVESTKDMRKGEDVPGSSLGIPKADDFGRSVSKIAVAQICESVGYQGYKESALEALADISIRYLCDLGKNASFHANLAGRTECNVFDIRLALEDLGDSHGFPGASEIGNCLVGSGIVKEIVQFVDTKEEIPFAQPVPRFPVVRSGKLIPSFEHMNETPPGKHIPSWLPAFPDPHTYNHTPMWNERASDPCADKIEQARQRRKAERALLRLQQRLVCNGSTGTCASSVLDAKTENIQEAGSNPFLSAPLQQGEKDVSEVVLPAKLSNEVSKGDHISLLDAFVPAIDAMKTGPSDRLDGEKTFLPEKRPSVQFKFKTGKKILGESLDLSLQRKGERSSTFLLPDDERDDKKKRAEFILRQTTEYPMELNQS
ncbi:transcription initiation factor TFIID subunit 8-like isoform X2 [Hibiscus syriacus]|uniref:transcription initiation factor TFIID subunit 8-like isoform X2 n=1 Tax=Hibiscus syriacus TaxID=106335 RepID=UPI0019218416|nr:transcription initiation factor TFIID subunit 8-like isoform X2 [Hibiscus syriacus]